MREPDAADCIEALAQSLRNAENLRDAANEIVRTGRVSRRAGWAEYLVMILTDAADCIEALAARLDAEDQGRAL